MDVRPVSYDTYLLINIKKGCLFAAYFLMVFQVIFGVQLFYKWINKESVLRILKADTMDSWGNFVHLTLSIGVVLVMSIITISSMVILLAGLHRGDTRLITVSLTLSIITLIVSISISILVELTYDINPVLPLNRLLVNVVTASFLCMTINYWVNIEMSKWILEDVLKIRNCT